MLGTSLLFVGPLWRLSLIENQKVDNVYIIVYKSLYNPNNCTLQIVANSSEFIRLPETQIVARDEI